MIYANYGLKILFSTRDSYDLGVTQYRWLSVAETTGNAKIVHFGNSIRSMTDFLGFA